MKQRRPLTWMRRTIAFILIFVGFVALITPFTPGSWLMLIGLGMLLDKNAAEVLQLLKEKYANATAFLRRRK